MCLCAFCLERPSSKWSIWCRVVRRDVKSYSLNHLLIAKKDVGYKRITKIFCKKEYVQNLWRDEWFAKASSAVINAQTNTANSRHAKTWALSNEKITYLLTYLSVVVFLQLESQRLQGASEQK